MRETTLCDSSIDLQCGVGSMRKCVTDVSSRSIHVYGAWIGGFTSDPRPVKAFGRWSAAAPGVTETEWSEDCRGSTGSLVTKEREPLSERQSLRGGVCENHRLDLEHLNDKPRFSSSGREREGVNPPFRDICSFQFPLTPLGK